MRSHDSRKRINPQRNQARVLWAGKKQYEDIAYQGIMDLMAYMLKRTMAEYASSRTSEYSTLEQKRSEIEEDIRQGLIARYLNMKDIREEDFITLCRKRAGIA